MCIHIYMSSELPEHHGWKIFFMQLRGPTSKTCINVVMCMPTIRNDALTSLKMPFATNNDQKLTHIYICYPSHHCPFWMCRIGGNDFPSNRILLGSFGNDVHTSHFLLDVLCKEMWSQNSQTLFLTN